MVTTNHELPATNDDRETISDNRAVAMAIDTGESATNDDNNILTAVLKALELREETNASQKSYLSILNFGRGLYCKGNVELLNKWPRSWSACLDLMKQQGYKEPFTYYACLNADHPNKWSLLENSTDFCKHCNQPGTIHQSDSSSETVVWQ